MSRRQSQGDGDPCPQDPAHGLMYYYPESRRQFCPHSAHKGPYLYEHDGVTPVTAKSATITMQMPRGRAA